jgi:hypothetical protein
MAMSIDEEIEEELTFEETDAVDYDQLSIFLSEFVRIGKDTGKIIKRNPFEERSIEDRIIIALLTERLRKYFGHTTSEWLTPDEIGDFVEGELSDAYPQIRDLELRGILQNREGKYRIQNQDIEDAIDTVE